MKTKTKLISGSFIMKTFVLFSFLAIFSCSQNETTNNVEEVNSKDLNFDNLRIDLGDLNIETDSIILFQANHVEELNNHLETTFADFMFELDEIVRTNEDVDLYEFNLRFHQGQALITDIYFYNSDREEIVDIFETGNAPDCVACNIGSILAGSCPGGYSSQGVCFNQPCVESTLSQVLTPALSSTGDCIMLHISRGALGVRICSKVC